jgi:hypothetical protein
MLRQFFWHRPLLYQALQKLRGRERPYDLNYDILFGGFPRSGNTFGSFMLDISQQKSLKIASHRHIPPPFIYALQKDKPICLTLRRPLDSLISWAIFTNSNYPIESIIRYYFDFHQVLFPYRSKFLVLPFYIITEDFPLVIRLINRRFGLQLDSQFDLEACKNEAFARIDNHWRNESGIVNESQVGRPSLDREARKQAIREELLRPRYASLLQRCEVLYRAYEKEFLAKMNQYGDLVPDGRKVELYLEKFKQYGYQGDTSQGSYIA